MTMESRLKLRIRAIAQEASGIHSYELVDDGGGTLPPFSAGAHVTLHLPCGLSRSYSLTNCPAERHRYVIAVNRDTHSRGGSRYLHETARVGQALQADPPRNLFELVEEAPASVFIAGGIGITPIRCMIRRLETLGRSWRLHYCARHPGAAAYVDELREDPRVQLYFDAGDVPRRLDIAEALAQLPADAHVYCCGPGGMLRAFREHAAALAPGRAHAEQFAPDEAPAAAGGYSVRLARTGRTVPVLPGQSILQALLEAGEQPPHACCQGVCGSCETAVLAGRPDHRDQVLSDTEKAAGASMMICCSGSLDPELVLDL
ncbi:PDR/VanB family oxidoreductase [Bordetella genomosp. 11]|nr:PDR/VanB family oxidoreductase [Bordetella genomosp. 11]